MRPRVSQALAVLIVLAMAVWVNGPPGEWLGEPTSLALWATLMAVATLGGLVSVIAAGRRIGWVGTALMVPPLLGPVPELGSAGFIGLAVAAWAMALHLELSTFAQRRARWADRLGEDADEALPLYERAYGRSTVVLAVVLAAALAVTVGAFVLLRAVAPASFADSVEARHVEGLFAFVMVIVLALAGLALIARDRSRSVPATGEVEP